MTETVDKGPEDIRFDEVLITPENIDLLSGIRNEVDGVDSEKLAREVRRYAESGERKAIVIVNGGKVAGYVEIDLEEDLPEQVVGLDHLSDYAHISRIGRAVEFKGEQFKAGDRLIEIAEREVRSSGRKGVWLDYLSDNTNAVELYRRNKYENLAVFIDDRGRQHNVAAKSL